MQSHVASPSLEIHPLWYYQRNVIVEPVTEGAEHSDGVVLEACPTRRDLLNPTRFFGGALKMVPNMWSSSKSGHGCRNRSTGQKLGISGCINKTGLSRILILDIEEA